VNQHGAFGALWVHVGRRVVAVILAVENVIGLVARVH
jgi:hypothetical protein